MDSGTRLFVYIPSYRRPLELGAQLERLLPQLDRHAGRVRVLVSDNASPGPEYAELRARYERRGIAFRRNGANVGGNANIAMGFTFAEPDEYLWILSDDDLVAPDALDVLLPRLSRDVDLLVMRPDIEREEEIAYAWQSGWSEPLKSHTGLISAVIFNFAAFAPFVGQAFPFHNTSFAHLAVILAKAREEGTVRFRLLPQKFHYNPAGQGDYSVSLTGFPQLSLLMPRQAGEQFCAEWLRLYRPAFLANAARQPLNFLSTIGVMRGYGGELRERAEEVERSISGADPGTSAAADLFSAVDEALRMGALAEVAALLAAYEARLGDDPDFLVAKAKWNQAEGRPAESLELLRRVMARHPGHGAALETLSALVESLRASAA